MKKVIWTPLAQSELDETLYYIAVVDQRPEIAENLFFEIQDRVKQQVEQELPGHSHPAAPDDWVYFQIKRWLIFYQPHAKGIEIMRIIDAVRDLPEQFRQN